VGTPARNTPLTAKGPRAELVEALTRAVRDALLGGDVAAARVALAALGELTGATGPGGSVVAFSEARKRRGEP
jgi:hypothetical protein